MTEGKAKKLDWYPGKIRIVYQCMNCVLADGSIDMRAVFRLISCQTLLQCTALSPSYRMTFG